MFFAWAACDEVDDIVRVTRKAVVDSVCLTGVGALERRGPGCVWAYFTPTDVCVCVRPS